MVTTKVEWSGKPCCRKVTVTRLRDGVVDSVAVIEMKHDTLLKVFERVVTFMGEHGTFTGEALVSSYAANLGAVQSFAAIAEELKADVITV